MISAYTRRRPATEETVADNWGKQDNAYLHALAKAGRAESEGKAVDKMIEMTLRAEDRASLERQTAAYFRALTSQAAAEEVDLEDVLGATSQEIDFDRP